MIIAEHLPNRGDQEWVEFKEVPGPATVRVPEVGPIRGTIMEIMFVGMRPKEEAVVGAGWVGQLEGGAGLSKP